jgi:hypothetical protein
MIVHSCWCICFIGMSAQGLNSKDHLNSNRLGVSKGLEKKKGTKWKSKTRSQPAQPGRLLSSPWANSFPLRPDPPRSVHRPLSSLPSAAPHRPPPPPPPHRPSSLPSAAPHRPLPASHQPARAVPPPLSFWLFGPTYQLPRLPSSSLLPFFPTHRPPEISGDP